MSDLKVDYAPGLAPPSPAAPAAQSEAPRREKPAPQPRPQPEKGSPAELADKAFMRNRQG